MQVDYVVHTYRMYSVQDVCVCVCVCVQDVCLYIHVPMGCKVGNIGSYQSIVISSSKRELWTRKYKKIKIKIKKKKKKSQQKSATHGQIGFWPPFFLFFSHATSTFMVASMPLFTHLPGARYYNYVGSLP